jgi:hypothetical protein
MSAETVVAIVGVIGAMFAGTVGAVLGYRFRKRERLRDMRIERYGAYMERYRLFLMFCANDLFHSDQNMLRARWNELETASAAVRLVATPPVLRAIRLCDMLCRAVTRGAEAVHGDWLLYRRLAPSDTLLTFADGSARYRELLTAVALANEQDLSTDDTFRFLCDQRPTLVPDGLGACRVPVTRLAEIAGDVEDALSAECGRELWGFEIPRHQQQPWVNARADPTDELSQMLREAPDDDAPAPPGRLRRWLRRRT